MFNGHCYNNHNNYDNTTKTKYSKSHENTLETRMKVNVLLDQPEQSTVPSCIKISYTDLAYRNKQQRCNILTVYTYLNNLQSTEHIH